MDPITIQQPGSPGTPLFALSPERVNGIRPPYNGSPRTSASPAELGSPKQLGSPVRIAHSRGGSDVHVQGMVARFNSLELRDPKELHKRDEIAIKRAEMAREMAELDSKKLKEEKEEIETQAKKIREDSRKYKKEIEESKERERKVAKRLEVIMDELHRTKETHSHAQNLYEKEIRKARKEAFKSSSMLVKLQEELKATRTSLRITQSGFESEKMKVAKREQETFQAQYQLISVQEELEKAREQIKVVELERDALKTSLKEEEVARIAAEGRIALPPSDEFDEEFASPRRSPAKNRREDSSGSDKENFIVPPKNIELKTLHEELDAERRRRERAEDTIEFMKMECQFQCCSCRVAELNGDNYIHDDSFEKEMERIRSSLPTVTPPASDSDMEDVTKAPEVQVKRPETPVAAEKSEQEKQNEQRELLFSPTSGTFRSVPSPTKTQAEAEEKPEAQQVDTAMDDAPEATLEATTPEVAAATPEPEAQPEAEAALPAPAPSAPTSRTPDAEITTVGPPSSPPRTPAQAHTPAHRLIRTITTTTTIPMCFDSPKPTAALYATINTNIASTASTPATTTNTPASASKWGALPIDREAALEQIRERRGRARSVAEGTATPRRQMVQGIVGMRRDVSAPV